MMRMRALWIFLFPLLLPLVVGEEEDVEVVGLGNDCGERSQCASNLKCIKLQCHCDSKKGFILNGEGTDCMFTDIMEQLKDYDALVEGNDNPDETVWPMNVTDWEVPETHDGPLPYGESRNNAESESSSEETEGQVAQRVGGIRSPMTLKGTESTETEKESDDKGIQEGANHDEEGEEFPPSEEGEDYVNDYDDPHSCRTNEDCQSTRMGKYSICVHRETPDHSYCECYDTEGKDRRTLEVNGTCYVWKEISDECATDDECDAVIHGPAFCDLDTVQGGRFCSCQPFHVWDDEDRVCLPYVQPASTSSCITDAQCFQLLGPLGQCSNVGACECPKVIAADGKSVFMYKGQCVEEKEMGSRCLYDQECEASLGDGAACHPHTLTCICAPGRFCADFSLRSKMSGITIFVLGLTIMLVIAGSIFCFIKKDRGQAYYSFLGQQNYV